VNEAHILGLINDDFEFQVHNIDEMIHNIERHDDDDQYSNGELAKYKKTIEDFKKSFYHGCAAQYTRLFTMVKLFRLKARNGCVTPRVNIDLTIFIKVFIKEVIKWLAPS
jgi:hypothetical protein